MKVCRAVLLVVAMSVRGYASTSTGYAFMAGPFEPTLESLKAYRCPDWFRDAKFGIWSHWGPQAVPMRGDWYARRMYEEGSAAYKDHLERWGHPSQHGYKDIIPLWKAEKWDPDRLMALYKRAGARYFVSMGSHHDNFFLWDSKVHRWNAVQMGPRRDVVGEWQKAARKYGLRFGVSEHLGASFTWFQSAHRADKSGPLAGVPYDGANPAFQDLYHWPAEPGDTKWYSTDPRWHRRWYECIRELVDRYQPDLLYADGAVPFGDPHKLPGLSMIAHFYNSSAQRHGGVPDVVYTCKEPGEGRWVHDIERGVLGEVQPYPWQTDTSIGDWYYNVNWKYRPVSWVIHMLVDIVSKNGNLLLNVVQRPDGSLDPEVEQQLEELAKWFAVHGEAIYETRPWGRYGEGRVRTRGGHFKEDFNFTARDIRFTTKGGVLYAIALGWPTNTLRIRSLARAAGNVESVEVLGCASAPQWRQTDEALEVEVPSEPVSTYTCALRITGRDLRPAPVPEEPVVVEADGQGNIVLRAEDAELHGTQIRLERRGMRENVGYWDRADEWVEWLFLAPSAGVWNVRVEVATVHPRSELELSVGSQTQTLEVTGTGDWETFRTVAATAVQLESGVTNRVVLRPARPEKWSAVNVRGVRLTPTAPTPK